jgi:hypothetical protein
MLDHFRAFGPKFWWIVVVGFTRDLDESNLTQAQGDCLTLDAQALCFLTNALKHEIFGRVMTSRSAHDMWMALKYLYGDFSIWDDGKFKEDDHMEMVHEDVEHDHNLVIVEDCSTSWSSDDDERSTTSSLDKVDDDASSDEMVMLLHTHLMAMMMDHAPMALPLQTHLLHHITSCHKVTPRYLMQM